MLSPLRSRNQIHQIQRLLVTLSDVYSKKVNEGALKEDDFQVKEDYFARKKLDFNEFQTKM